jgi:hypothetical protein
MATLRSTPWGRAEKGACEGAEGAQGGAHAGYASGWGSGAKVKSFGSAPEGYKVVELRLAKL